MRMNNLIRRSHRWVAILFFAGFAAASFAAATGRTEESVLYYLPLPPLFLLMLSGLYMLLQPTLSRWRRGSGRAA